MCVADIAAVFRVIAFDRNDVADLHRVASPAVTHEQVRARELHAPVHDLARIVLDIDVEPGVRVLPLDARDGARQRGREIGRASCRERV